MSLVKRQRTNDYDYKLKKELIRENLIRFINTNNPLNWLSFVIAVVSEFITYCFIPDEDVFDVILYNAIRKGVAYNHYLSDMHGIPRDTVGYFNSLSDPEMIFLTIYVPAIGLSL